MFNSNPIFIGGMAKSGTSLLRSLVGSHPNIYGGDGFETNWFGDEIRKDWKDQTSERQRWLREWHNIDDQDFKAIKSKSISGLDYFNNVMNYCTDKAKKKRWIEKTPNNIHYFDLITDTWPNAKLIICVRDLRDVFASWKVKAGSNLKNHDVYEFTDKVLHAFSDYHDLLGKQTENYIDIKYEDTVKSTEQTLKRVLNYLEEPWVEGLENYKPSGELEKVKRIIGKGSTTSESLEKPIFTSSIGQWKEFITDNEIAVIDDKLGDFQNILGYES